MLNRDIEEKIIEVIENDDEKTVNEYINLGILKKDFRMELLDIPNAPLTVHAAAHGCEKILKLLMDNKFDVKPEPNDKENALTAVCARGHYTFSSKRHHQKLRIAMILVSLIDINSKNDKGDTPLHIAISSGFYEMVKFLLEHHADENQVNKKGITPFGQISLTSALPSEKKEIVDLYIGKILTSIGIFKQLQPTILDYIHREESDDEFYDRVRKQYDSERLQCVG